MFKSSARAFSSLYDRALWENVISRIDLKTAGIYTGRAIQRFQITQKALDEHNRKHGTDSEVLNARKNYTSSIPKITRNPDIRAKILDDDNVLHSLLVIRGRAILDCLGERKRCISVIDESSLRSIRFKKVSALLLPGEFLHICKSPVSNLAFRNRDCNTTEISTKPRGLFYSTSWSDPDSWLRFASGALSDCPLDGFQYGLKFTEEDSRSILTISNLDDLKAFESKYGYCYFDSANEYIALFIDWDKVKSEGFKGIQIIPFLEDFAKLSDWYSSWDCSSGIIWDAELVRLSLRQIRL
jgi:hypothetical protein